MLMRMWRKGNPFALLVGMQTGVATVESSMEISQKIKNGFAFDPTIPLVEIHPKKSKTLIRKNISIPVFIKVFFIITKIWKQPKCPSVDEWVKQLWDIYTMKYNPAVKNRRKFYHLQKYGRTRRTLC